MVIRGLRGDNVERRLEAMKFGKYQWDHESQQEHACFMAPVNGHNFPRDHTVEPDDMNLWCSPSSNLSQLDLIK